MNSLGSNILFSRECNAEIFLDGALERAQMAPSPFKRTSIILKLP